jgi:hypothetical protein
MVENGYAPLSKIPWLIARMRPALSGYDKTIEAGVAQLDSAQAF